MRFMNSIQTSMTTDPHLTELEKKNSYNPYEEEVRGV
jgi:hypothetical protein